MKNFDPNGNRILVKPHEAKRESAKGLILPDTAVEKSSTAVICAMGSEIVHIDELNANPDKYKNNPNFRFTKAMVGQECVFAKNAGTEVQLDGEDYLIIRFDDFFGTI